MMTLLDVNNLSVRFATEDRQIDAVRNVSFHINASEILALVGESGSGKSVTALSLLQLLPGAATYPSGSILFNGTELCHADTDTLLSVRGKGIGMIFQEPMTALNPLHTIGQQITESIQQSGKHAGAAQATRLKELMDAVELEHLTSRLGAYPHQLSGGERQRVMIAMALAGDPQLLIADEPTTALDVTTQQEILLLLSRLCKERHMAILLITHDLTLVRKFAHRVAIMSQGALVEQNSVSTLFANPEHPYTRQLLSAAPSGNAVPLAAEITPVISCEGLSVRFPLTFNLFGSPKTYLTALTDTSLSLNRGETLGVVGESGSGKSTLGFALLRLLPANGKIVFSGSRIDGLSSAAMRPLRKSLQVVFQDPYSSLNPRMTVGDIITEGLEIHEASLSKAQRESRLEVILTEVGLEPDMKRRYPHEFSGGQRQRIAIARAMILRPQFVVLDEPTSALDLSVQSQIIDLLKKFQKEYGVTYIFISHDLRVVKAISHRIIVMQRGNIIECGSAEEIFRAPQNHYTAQLIEAAFGEPLIAENI